MWADIDYSRTMSMYLHLVYDIDRELFQNNFKASM